MYRPMKPEDEAIIRQMLNIREPIALPKKVVDQYWVMRGFVDRANGGALSIEACAWLCLQSDLRVPNKVGNAALKAISAGEVRRDDDIIVVWRNEFKVATYKSLRPNGQIVAVLKDDGNPVEREFDPSDVEIMDAGVKAE